MPRGYVMALRIIFGKIIRFVGFSWAPIMKKCPWSVQLLTK